MKEEKDISKIDLLISNCLSGNNTDAQNTELMQWMETAEENRIYFSRQKALWLSAEQEISAHQEEKWVQLKYKLQERRSNITSNLIQDNKRTPNKFKSIFRYAASIVVLFGVSILVYFILKPASSMVLAKNELSVPYGSRSVLSLPDGTKLWINSGSKVSYGIDFGKNNRNVNLIGEAYFEVAKNPNLPFIVHAANVKIKAIGTAFNVKAYPEEKRVETTLVHGLVEVEKDGQTDRIYLKPNQKIILASTLQDNTAVGKSGNSDHQQNNSSSNEISNRTERLMPKIDTEKETSWKEGKLIFDREPLSALVIRLERRYDVHFTFGNEELKNYVYTGTFNDVSLEQIMEAMYYSSPIDYVIKEKEVKIMKKKNYK